MVWRLEAEVAHHLQQSLRRRGRIIEIRLGMHLRKTHATWWFEQYARPRVVTWRLPNRSICSKNGRVRHSHQRTNPRPFTARIDRAHEPRSRVGWQFVALAIELCKRRTAGHSLAKIS